jgi:hypothetical protein
MMRDTALRDMQRGGVLADYWLKISGDRTHAIKSEWRPDYERWNRERGGSMFPRRPTILPGDFLVLYAAGSPKAFGEGKTYAVEIAKASPRRGNHERWKWLVETEEMWLAHDSRIARVSMTSASARCQSAATATSD